MRKLRCTRSWLWLLIFGQLAAAFWMSRPWMMGDSQQYLELAAALSEGRYGSNTATGFVPNALRPPGYPLFLWLLLHVLHLPIAGVVLLQLGFYLVGIYLIERFLRRQHQPSWPFLGLVILYPFPALYVARVATEGPVILALTWMATGLGVTRPTTFRLIALGTVAGVAALIRSDLALVPIVMAGVVIVRELRGGAPFTQVARRAVLIPLFTGLVAAPYGVHNALVFGNPLPVAPAGAVGNSLYLSTWQELLSTEDLNAVYFGRFTEKARNAGLDVEVRRLNRDIGAPETTCPFNPACYATPAEQIRSTQVFGRAARQRIISDPRPYAHHVLHNVWWLWNTSALPPSLGPLGTGLLLFLATSITLAGLLGGLIALSRPRDWPLPASMTLMLFYIPALHLWLHTEARYTAPARLILLLHAAVFLSWCVKRVLLLRSGRHSAEEIGPGEPSASGIVPGNTGNRPPLGELPPVVQPAT